MTTNLDTDVIIIGAGPVGLTLANLLAVRGHHAIVVEARSELIDYPRGVGLDDEAIRTLRTAGLWDQIEQFTVPHHVVRLVNGEGQVLATNDPQTQEFGFARKHGFNQPVVDRELARGLGRFQGTELRFGHRVIALEDHGHSVVVTAEQLDAEGDVTGTVQITGRYAVGCEGGSSFTRKWMTTHHGVEFEGKSPSTRWIVADVQNDPIGVPNVYLGADPRRPYVSIGLPQGLRRFEFMLHDHEPSELAEDRAFIDSLLAGFVPDPASLVIINQRTFTHHGRVATSFRTGNVFLAGDAAHLMPVWLGQGWNSGIRDATNLAWKLTAVLAGQAGEAPARHLHHRAPQARLGHDRRQHGRRHHHEDEAAGRLGPRPRRLSAQHGAEVEVLLHRASVQADASIRRRRGRRPGDADAEQGRGVVQGCEAAAVRRLGRFLLAGRTAVHPASREHPRCHERAARRHHRRLVGAGHLGNQPDELPLGRRTSPSARSTGSGCSPSSRKPNAPGPKSSTPTRPPRSPSSATPPCPSSTGSTSTPAAPSSCDPTTSWAPRASTSSSQQPSPRSPRPAPCSGKERRHEHGPGLHVPQPAARATSTRPPRSPRRWMPPSRTLEPS